MIKKLFDLLKEKRESKKRKAKFTKIMLVNQSILRGEKRK